MPNRLGLALVCAAALAIYSAPPAAAQDIPTTAEVQDGLDASCKTLQLIEITGPLDKASEIAACLVEIAGSIEVAAAYAALNPPDEPPQVEIGFMLCQLAVTRPALEPVITALIAASENPLLVVGCQAALANPAAGPGDGGGGPAVITPG
jgi:hypothetical protein